jgi:hypothetical protein
MWSANRKANRPYPYVRVVRLDETMKAVVDEPDIWSAGYAFAYPDAYPNEEGDVGVTVFRGGGTRYPGHVVGFRDDTAGAWRLRTTRDSSMGQPTASGGTT